MFEAFRGKKQISNSNEEAVDNLRLIKQLVVGSAIFKGHWRYWSQKRSEDGWETKQDSRKNWLVKKI